MYDDASLNKETSTLFVLGFRQEVVHTYMAMNDCEIHDLKMSRR